MFENDSVLILKSADQVHALHKILLLPEHVQHALHRRKPGASGNDHHVFALKLLHRPSLAVGSP